MGDIYGVESDRENITPLMVRDAMVECFFQAHCEDSGIALGEGKEDETANRNYCREVVRKAFREGGGDFDRPTREGIVSAMQKLAEFAANFRNPEIIKKHASEIMVLVRKMRA